MILKTDPDALLQNQKYLRNQERSLITIINSISQKSKKKINQVPAGRRRPRRPGISNAFVAFVSGRKLECPQRL